jgi:hypothetical protein
MADVIDFTEKFKQKLMSKDAESAADANSDAKGEPPPAGQDESSQTESGIEEKEPDDCPAGTSSEEQASAGPVSGKHVDLLICAVIEQADFFHTPEREPFATIRSEDRYITWPVRSYDFKMWMQWLFYQIYGGMPKSTALRDAQRQFEGVGLFEGPKLDVHLRYAGNSEAVYIDLANKAWEQIRITKEGWSIIKAKDSPIKFKRAKGMLPLCYPGQQSASMEDIGRFFNVKAENDLVLIVSWLLGAMQPEGPFPILVLQGEQGSAKSTTARLLKDLIDPSTVPLRTLPSCERDLAIAASKVWTFSVDNLSGLPVWLSDAFCRLATGGGFGARTLYTDDSEILFNARRPLILNGISDIATRHDLADRALIVHLPPIRETKRLPEKRLDSAWSKAKPAILKTLLDAVVSALRNLKDVALPGLPRMADFATWVSAAEEGLRWPKGTFMKAYEVNRMNLIDIALEADIVATAILVLMEEGEEWSGTPSELYEDLKRKIPDYERRSNAWPRGANVLSGRLVRAQTFLRKKGIEIERTKSGSRNITIRRIGGKGAEPCEELLHQPPVQPESQGSLRVVNAGECECLDFPVKPATITEHGPEMEPSTKGIMGKFKLSPNQNQDIVEGEI